MIISLTLLLLGLRSHAETLNPANVTEKYFKEKTKVVVVDQKSREIMGALYELNQRMKTMSKKRDILNNKMISADGNVKYLVKQTTALETRIKEQRHHLSKRLRAIYMLGDEGVVRVIFSSANSQDLDQSLKYLRLISEHDFSLIRSYEKNLVILNRKKERLKGEVRKLLAIKDRIKDQEMLLSRDQSSKAVLLDKLKGDREKSIAKLAGLRGKAEDFQLQDLLDISFYEKKGQLTKPIQAKLKQEFGLIENEEFQYRLSHKGLYYETAKSAVEVKSVFGGRVAFVGEIQGYGSTVIIDHGDHYYSVYSNADRISVQEGQKVTQNQIIAACDHGLYFEIRHFSDAIDPQAWLKEI